jgi:phage protein D
MKKTIFKITAIALLTSTTFIRCNTPAEKVEKAEENVAEANKDLDKAKEEYLTDIETYKKETDTKIAANNQSLIDFRTRIANEKQAAKDEYEKKIAELDKKNTDMKKMLDDYKAEGKEKWDLFKNDFNNEMDKINRSMKDLTTNYYQEKNIK